MPDYSNHIHIQVAGRTCIPMHSYDTPPMIENEGVMVPNPEYDAGLAYSISAGARILFKMDGSSLPPATVRFYPEGYEPDGQFYVLNPPYHYIHIYNTLGQRKPEVRVFSDMTDPNTFASGYLSDSLDGVEDGFINIFAHRPVAKITALGGMWNDSVQQFWNSEAIHFSLAGTKYFSNITATAIRYTTDGEPIARNISVEMPSDGGLPEIILGVSANGILELGVWEVRVTVESTIYDTVDDTVTFVVVPHKIELRAYHPGDIEIENNLIVGGLTEQNLYTVSGMPPLRVLFVAPNTTTDQISLDLDSGSSSSMPNRVIIPRTATIERETDPNSSRYGYIKSGPNFEYEHQYLIPAGFPYKPQAVIVTNVDLNITLSSTRNISINVQPAILDILEPFPGNGGFVPRAVTVHARTNAGALTFDFDAHEEYTVDNPFNYTQSSLGVIDPDTPCVYYRDANDFAPGDTVSVTHTYNKATDTGYLIRVTTNRNDNIFDVQRTRGLIRVGETIGAPNQNGQGFPGFTFTVDQNNSAGTWIELIPGDYRTVRSLGVVGGLNMANWDTLDDTERQTAVIGLWSRSIKLVTLNDGVSDIDYCVIYYKSNTSGQNGRPWIFEVTYNELGVFNYKTYVYPSIPPYPYAEELGLVVNGINLIVEG